MSKKMKGVDLGSSTYGLYVDAKARFKHQTLIQDYQELQKETELTRGKLESVKQRKLTLMAEVRFLRRRYKYILENNPTRSPQELVPRSQQNLEINRKSKSKAGPVSNKRETSLQNLPLAVNGNKMGKLHMGKEPTVRTLTMNRNVKAKVALRNKKEAKPVLDLNQRGRMYGDDGAVIRNPTPVFDLNQNGSFLGGKETVSKSRQPIFDLNEISREEDDIEDNSLQSRLEESKKGIIKLGTEETLNDLKLSICRNVGDNPSRAGKRKISWQDPVALRV